ncbi:PAS domain S-box protein [Caldimonas tepidiphila]|uniref:PAS domain S-box protein n=1 Tax=Caldimonas tepidiphila TaxID=2315841 RepID=UPI000E5C3467|nr:PAS domain S-box protein [Caldimonas tepidiphila]
MDQERPPSPPRSTWVLPAAVLLASLGLTGSGVYMLDRSIETAAQVRFSRQLDRVEREIQQRFRQPVHAVNSLRSVLTAFPEPGPDVLRTYVEARDLPGEFPGLRGLGFGQRVLREDLERFVAAERSAGRSGFQVRTSGKAPDLYVLKFIEPIEQNRAAWGFDIGSEAVRRAAIERAALTGEPTLTARITLVQDDRQGAGFMYMAPVYRGGDLPEPAGRRLSELAGLVVAPIVVRELLAGIAEVADEQLDIALYDGPATDPARLVYELHETQADRPHALPSRDPLFEAERGMTIGGRTLTLRALSTPAFETEIDRGLQVALGVAGVLLSGLLALSAWLLAVGRARAETLAREMTADLRRLAKVVQHTSNAVFITDAERRITWVNRGFERIFGYRHAEALGHTPGELLDSDRTDPAELQRIREAQQRGEPYQGELLQRGKDGRDAWIDVELQPLHGERGELTGFMAIESDITAQKDAQTRLQAALRETQALLRTIDLHAIVSVADRSGRIVDVNEAFVRTSGYPREELLGQDHRILDSGVHLPAFWAEMRDTIGSGRPWRGEICNRARDGSLYWVSCVVAPFVGLDGTIEKYVSICTDVTESRLAHERLSAMTARLELAIEGSNDGLWDWMDVRSEEAWWSPTFYELLGYRPGEVPASIDTFRSLLHPQHRERVTAALDQALRGGPAFDTEAPLRSKSGEWRWFRGRAKVYFDAAGKAQRMAGSLQDIHDRKQAEAALSRTTAQLRSVLDAASEVSVIATGLDGSVTVFNRGAEQLLGWEAGEIVGRHTLAKFHDPQELEQRRAELSAELGRAVEAAEVFAEEARLARPREWSYVRRDGSRVSVSLVITEMRADDGETIGRLSLAQDITLRKEHEASLREARARAEQANVAKSQFLANMSHEIRTPMNAIIGMTDLALEGELNADQRELLTVVKDSARSLLNLVNDILDFSKVEAGHLEFEHVGFDLLELVAATTRTLDERARGKGLALDWIIAPGVPRRVVGDPHRLRQVLLNLLSNAVKFTQRGGVTLIVSQRGEDHSPGTCTLHFRVRDTGIGIAPDKLEAVFEPFTQADASTTRRFGGTGLGLSISRRLVSLMGGTMWARSTPGAGSTFYFTATFGLAAADGDDAEDGDEGGEPGSRVLVLDASPLPDARLGAVLETWRLRPVTVPTLAEAVRRLESLAPHHRAVQSVLAKSSALDVRGDSDLALLRRLCDTGSHRRVAILLEDEAVSEEVRTAFERSVAWPAVPSMLFDALTSVEGFTHSSLRERRGWDATRWDTPAENCRILLAEDNPINQKLAIRLLEGMGHRVEVAGDGEEAMQRACAEAFDLILMDVQMPNLSGFEATGAIRDCEQALGRRTPIVAMTAHAMVGDRERCLAAGMDGYLSKPISRQALHHEIQTHALRRAADGAAAAGHPLPAAEAPEPPAPPPGDGAASPAALYDRDRAVAMLGGDEGLFDELAEMFAADADAQVQVLRQAAAAGDLARLGALAHAQKGAVSMLAATAASETAARLEAACNAKQHEPARGLAETLCRQLLELKERLARDLAGTERGTG